MILHGTILYIIFWFHFALNYIDYDPTIARSKRLDMTFTPVWICHTLLMLSLGETSDCTSLNFAELNMWYAWWYINVFPCFLLSRSLSDWQLRGPHHHPDAEPGKDG